MRALGLGGMLAVVTGAQAASITLESINSGVFQYQLTLAPSDNIVFDNGGEITLTGLAGVTATMSLNSGFTSCGFPASSVCFEETFETQTLTNPSDSPTAFNFFTVTSTAGSVDLVDYTAGATTPFSGQVDGPVAGTEAPEPGAGLLTAAGLLGLILCGAVRVLPR